MARNSSHYQFLAVVIIIILSQISNARRSGPPCNGKEIRLVDGEDKFHGRVEMCDEGEWKTVCDDGWGKNEAKVVCRQLRYQNGVGNARKAIRSCTGKGSQHIIQKRWGCNGNEQQLHKCSTSQPALGTCDHRRDAGVFCSGNAYCTGRDLRLVNGSNPESGRVEVCRHGCWGTVCDNGWDSNDAVVACRQLGFDTERAIPTTGAYFGEENLNDKPIILSQVRCKRNDSARRLIDCAGDRSALNDCEHSQDAGVICRGTNPCDDGDVRLVGGKTEREGRVEICYNGVWGSVCADGWDEANANVICVQLGYGLPGVPLSYIGQVHSPVLFHNVTCNSSHSKLFQCVDDENAGIGIFRCDHVAEVTCPDIPKSITMASDNSLTAEESDTMSTQLKASSKQWSIVVGVVGGLLVVAAVTVVSVTVAVLMMKRRRKKLCKGKDIDIATVANPAYEGHIKMTSNQTEDSLYSSVQGHVGRI